MFLKGGVSFGKTRGSEFFLVGGESSYFCNISGGVYTGRICECEKYCVVFSGLIHFWHSLVVTGSRECITLLGVC